MEILYQISLSVSRVVRRNLKLQFKWVIIEPELCLEKSFIITKIRYEIESVRHKKQKVLIPKGIF